MIFAKQNRMKTTFLTSTCHLGYKKCLQRDTMDLCGTIMRQCYQTRDFNQPESIQKHQPKGETLPMCRMWTVGDGPSQMAEISMDSLRTIYSAYLSSRDAENFELRAFRTCPNFKVLFTLEFFADCCRQNRSLNIWNLWPTYLSYRTRDINQNTVFLEYTLSM